MRAAGIIGLVRAISERAAEGVNVASNQRHCYYRRRRTSLNPRRFDRRRPSLPANLNYLAANLFVGPVVFCGALAVY